MSRESIAIRLRRFAHKEVDGLTTTAILWPFAATLLAFAFPTQAASLKQSRASSFEFVAMYEGFKAIEHFMRDYYGKEPVTHNSVKVSSHVLPTLADWIQRD